MSDKNNIPEEYKKDFVFLEKQLNSAISMCNSLKKEMDERDKRRSAFFSRINHEVRTPLNSIIGFSDIFVENTHNNELVSYARSIKSASNKLLDVFSNINFIEQLDSFKPTISEYSTTTLIKTLIDFGRFESELKGINFQLHLHGNIPEKLHGDFTYITQMLRNLIANGINSTTNGYIYSELSAITHDNKTELVFIVKDTSVGLKASAKKEHDSVLNSDITDLASLPDTIDYGIIMVNYYAKSMGGKLTCFSKYGKGTTYTLTLPQVCNDIETFVSKDFIEEIELNRFKVLSAPNAKILVVDDSRVNLNVAKYQLSLYDIEADTAESGIKALSMIDDTKYDIVFMDHMMPDMDGVETTTRIRAQKGSYYKDLPIIALTANSTDDARALFVKIGFSDYMAKPIDKIVLTDMLYKWLPKTKIGFKADTTEKETFEKKYTIAFEKSGVDIDAGMTYTGGNMKSYVTVIKTLIKEAQTYEYNLASAFRYSKMADYGIYIHGVKGALASIGATTLSNRAYAMELEAKANNIDFINETHAPFVKDFKSLIDDLTKITLSYDLDHSDSIPSTKKSIPSEKLLDKLNTAIKSIDDYEIDDALVALNSILGYDLDDNTRKLVNTSVSKIDDFEYDEAICTLNEILNNNS